MSYEVNLKAWGMEAWASCGPDGEGFRVELTIGDDEFIIEEGSIRDNFQDLRREAARRGKSIRRRDYEAALKSAARLYIMATISGALEDAGFRV